MTIPVSQAQMVLDAVVHRLEDIANAASCVRCCMECHPPDKGLEDPLPPPFQLFGGNYVLSEQGKCFDIPMTKLPPGATFLDAAGHLADAIRDVADVMDRIRTPE